MRTCPICSGPLYVDNPGRVICDGGHEMTVAEAADLPSARFTEALSTALTTLETEAETWGSVAKLNGSPKAMENRQALANQADLIRDLLNHSDSDVEHGRPSSPDDIEQR